MKGRKKRLKYSQGNRGRERRQGDKRGMRKKETEKSEGRKKRLKESQGNCGREREGNEGE